ncbi:MAG: hypothetical protein A2541_02310 [Candidatus Taylorbacteria bacterium RIFOXYD2_FULL_36_9]|uniref:Uncharacterized protein n=1 Tax=Candidatus Taylorbacteria bacterium RIFOXYD2_FULL_36_9 TaxID=1802338 RepID=A0A1G2PIH6_9BACT|nr:MAG: hypothetical protein A2541_02310 [Candidatus Taylorbacteria bacterium RIFOXYD2_FULL_36_9]
MKSWIKGGLWGIGIYLLIMLLSFNFEEGFIWAVVSPGTWFIIGGRFGSSSWTVEFKYIMQVITSLISWGVLGVIISLIVEKIKSKRQVNI